MAFSKANDRIFYACQAVLMERVDDGPPLSHYNPTNASYLTGVRSVGVSGDFPSLSLMDVGRFQRKFHYYGKQSFEITIERVISSADNASSPNVHNSFFYAVDPSDYTTTYTDSHILSAKKDNVGDIGTADGSDKMLAQYHIVILYGPDRFAGLGAGLGVSGAEQISSDADKQKVYSVTYEHCLVTAINYRFDTEGVVTESITLTTRSVKYNNAPTVERGLYEDVSRYQLPRKGTVDGTPGSAQTGNVLKKEDIDVETNTKFPSEVNSMFDLSTTADDGTKILGLTSIDINIGFNYTEADDIGVWRGSDQTVPPSGEILSHEMNMWRFLNLPIEITTSFTGTARHMFPVIGNAGQGFPYGDYLLGASDFDPDPGTANAWQETDEQIRIVATKFPDGPSPTYFIWDLGEKNYLTSIDNSGGEAGGGSVETTLTYQNDTSDIVIARDTSVRDIVYPTTPH